MEKRRSGGARAAQKKREVQAGLRGPTFDAEEREAFAAVPLEDDSAAGAGREAVSYLRTAMRRAALDPGVEAHARREQVARFAAMLHKCTVPEERVEEAMSTVRDLSDEIRAFRERRMAERADRNGKALPARDAAAGALALPPT